MKIDAFVSAAQNNDIATLKAALDQNIDVDVLDREGWSALAAAANFAKLDTVQLLLSRGADVNRRNSDGKTPLFGAAQRGALDIVRALLDSGADVNVRDNDGHVPLNPALTNRQSQVHMEIIELFLSKGAEVDAQDRAGQTPLHQSARNNNVNGARLLLRSGASINVDDNDHKTPLQVHLEQNRGEEGAAMTELLTSRGAIAPGHTATLEHERGRRLFSEGRFKEALEALEAASGLNPHDAAIWYNMAAVLHELGRSADALECYDRVLKLEPRKADALNNKAVVLADMGRADDALENYNKAIEVEPNYAKAWLNKGLHLGQLGRYPDAIQCFRRATEIDEEYTAAWGNLGVAYEKYNAPDQALQSYRNYLAHAEAEPTEEIGRIRARLEVLEAQRARKLPPPLPSKQEQEGPKDEDWMFHDPPNTGVIITEDVAEGTGEVVFVSHKSNSEWYVVGERHRPGVGIGGFRRTSLREIVNMVPEIVEIADLPREWNAWRLGPGSEWRKSPEEKRTIAADSATRTRISPSTSKDRHVAAILALALGWLGVHKFYLGYTAPGIVMALFTVLTCGLGLLPMALVAAIEGIIYLTKTDDEFNQAYVVRNRLWF
jgi:ankyrin repeat protein/TM2 domain-containing membrane protein YozV